MLRQLVSGGFLILLSACSGMIPATQRNSTAILPEQILDDMIPGEDEFSPDLVYVSQKAQAASGRYDKILLDPIIYFAPLGQPRRIGPSDRQTLLNNFQVLMGRQLKKDFLLALEPLQGTVRVQFAILPATREPVAMDTVAMVARVDPSEEVVTDALASPIIAGPDLLIEAKWTDAVTGELLGATVDSHFGQASFDGTRLENWADVNRYLESYATLIRYRLCRFRALENCMPPRPPLG